MTRFAPLLVLLVLPLSCSSSGHGSTGGGADGGAGGASAGGSGSGGSSGVPQGGAGAAASGGSAANTGGAGGAANTGGAGTGGLVGTGGGAGSGGAGSGASACGFAPGATTEETALAPLFSTGGDPSQDASCTEVVNPERGFFRFVDLRSVGSLAGVRGEGYSLVYGKVQLDDYIGRDLDAQVLGELDGAFRAVRGAGLGVFPRFYYADDGTSPDAPESRVLHHIEQLGPLLRDHADVIVALYAGFVGAWGEWHSSTNQLTEPGPRKRILDALLAALPGERQVLVRRPSFKEAAYGGPLDAATAFSDAALARVGHHNDCFVSSDDDVGTYQLPGERDYLLADSAFAAFGGETCAVFPARSACAPAMTEMAAVHASFLNFDYHPGVVGGWQSGGCYDQIACRLGYRLALVRRESPVSVVPGEALGVGVRLVNDGYARPVNPRDVQIVLKGPVLRRLDIPIDVRAWAPGAPFDVCLSATVPSDLPAGDYVIGIALPARGASVKDDPRYAVRFAAGTAWDAAEGVNYTNGLVTVSAGAKNTSNVK